MGATLTRVLQRYNHRENEKRSLAARNMLYRTTGTLRCQPVISSIFSIFTSISVRKKKLPDSQNRPPRAEIVRKPIYDQNTTNFLPVCDQQPIHDQLTTNTGCKLVFRVNSTNIRPICDQFSTNLRPTLVVGWSVRL